MTTTITFTKNGDFKIKLLASDFVIFVYLVYESCNGIHLKKLVFDDFNFIFLLLLIVFGSEANL